MPKLRPQILCNKPFVMKYKMLNYLHYFKSISGSLRIFANKNRQMQESQSYKYLNLLEIISNINRIAREKKGVDETLMQIVESLPPHNNMANPVSLRITINNNEYLSREFSVENICMTSNFIATSGSRGKIDICSKFAKKSFSELEKKEKKVELSGSI